MSTPEKTESLGLEISEMLTGALSDSGDLCTLAVASQLSKEAKSAIKLTTSNAIHFDTGAIDDISSNSSKILEQLAGMEALVSFCSPHIETIHDLLDISTLSKTKIPLQCVTQRAKYYKELFDTERQKKLALIEEEKKRKAAEEKRLKLEQQRKQEEEQRCIREKLEKEKQEKLRQQQLAIEAEKRRKEEQQRKKEEAQRKEEERLRKIEEEKARKIQEAKRKEEEAKKKIEEEKQRKEEAARKIENIAF
ncbi:hypothetical protein ADUPG1_009626 [Aduncisulcus paluster]|uniref:Uncharacterized protein n=1 Tax=Aduncisulcus paluster TaxID=2918883 RepID=A0ABQ5L048_9EUKA|nr:hypothetical protein ADUPG1_009626 [Aduncisulcus paluster]